MTAGVGSASIYSVKTICGIIREKISAVNRKNLSNIRSGEYEGMSNKIKDKEWAPDYGCSELNINSGVTAVGAREFLIAYNINLNTKDHRLATDIAFELREAGRSKRTPNPNSKNLLDGEMNDKEL